MSDKRIVSIQLTKTKSVVAVEIGKDEYVDADGVTYKNIDTDFISDADDVSEEEKHAFGYMASLYDGIAELEGQKRAIDAKIAASKKEIKKAESVIRNLQGRMSIADFAEEIGDTLPEGLFDEMVDKAFWCDTALPGESVDENVMYILNVMDVSLRKASLESLPFMYEYEEYGDWRMYENAEEYLKYQRIVSAYAKTLPMKAEYISKLYYDKEEGLQCISAYKIKLEKKLTKEYAKEIVAKLTNGFVYEN
ncbi:hypothetical protein G7B22_32105 [Blautia sp. MSK.20.9]|uniref:hypothetical protein n=1 Tax=Blautia sp. MSK20_18 TaxID=2883186 RepID=UPI00156E7902|nr:hypothetical protein [Blautia sp. MSK20_18]MCB7509104.1 hypothetical protein [Blautia sp. MSK20_18]NSK12972.1 hypothetical protein [Blautia sp. MSK.20.9]